jgi:uncharacterized membrane protein YccF (DUF307 family)
MTEVARGPGWWQASDGRWYPPEAHPGAGSYYAARSPGAGSLLLNILWLVLSGVWLAILYAFAGVVLCITIIGIPFGLQCFKLAAFALWPFGRIVVAGPKGPSVWSVLGNVIWFVLVGIWMAIAHLFTGLLLCLTIIGIPLGLGNFKLIPMILFPFGKVIVPRNLV